MMANLASLHLYRVTYLPNFPRNQFLSVVRNRLSLPFPETKHLSPTFYFFFFFFFFLPPLRFSYLGQRAVFLMSSQSCYIKLPNSDFPIYERIHFWIFKMFFWSLLLTWNPTFHQNFTVTLLDLGVSSVIIGIISPQKCREFALFCFYRVFYNIIII